MRMKLFVVSFLVYVVVNVVENLIHYSIGKNSDHDVQFEMPTEMDWIKIIVVMLIFAGIQGILTCYFYGQC